MTDVLDIATAEPLADWRALYHQAFREFGGQALWWLRELEAPSPESAATVAKALRVKGDMRARFFAEKLEAACRAAQ